jgi:hypothetical protein
MNATEPGKGKGSGGLLGLLGKGAAGKGAGKGAGEEAAAAPPPPALVSLSNFLTYHFHAMLVVLPVEGSCLQSLKHVY